MSKTAIIKPILLSAAVLIAFLQGLRPVAAGPAPSVRPEPAAYSLTAGRPVFLSWPLPRSIGVKRIPQYPNTPWTWNYLGLNPGMQCPPMFGYLDNWDSRWYWRDPDLPEEDDRAQADPHDFDMVACYATEGQAGANGHEGTDIKAPVDTEVYAAADGRVMGWNYYGWATHIALKHCLGGAWDAEGKCAGGRQWYTTYMHVNLIPDLLVLEKEVRRGEKIATIYEQFDNSHLHFEVGLDFRQYDHFVNPWGRDAAPWDGCMWEDRSLCPQPDAQIDRLAAVDGSGRLYVREGSDAAWQLLREDVRRVQLTKRRVAVMDASGRLWGREGAPTEKWLRLADGVRDFAITGRRVAVLDDRGDLLMMGPTLYDRREKVAENAAAFSMTEFRLGVLDRGGNLLVREGPSTQWVRVAGNVRAFQLTGDRIGMIDRSGVLWAQEGSPATGWTRLAADVLAFQLEGLRVAALTSSGELWVMDGSLASEWLPVAEDVRSFQLSGLRIAILDRDGRLKLKTGRLDAAWTVIGALDLQVFQLDGTLPVMVP
jgi:murein DD-endopeptidase MepM/ murein hydrolase activator NlpD